MGMMIVLFAIAFAKVNALESSQKLQNEMFNVYAGNLDNKVHDLNESLLELSEEFLQNLDIFSDAFQEVITNISGSLNLNSFSSCSDILHHNPSSSSGYYLVRSSTDQLTSVYCDMTRTCGSITGGWMRVAELDVNNCPTGLIPRSFNGRKTCIRSENAPGCTPVLYNLFNIPFSKVCGQIRGYGFGSIDGLYIDGEFQSEYVNASYVDGISITSNGSHIWTFSAGQCDSCDNKPDFIGNDWTCEGSGCPISGILCTNILWDTNTCGRRTPFLKNLPRSTTADILMRVCRDENRSNEDIGVSIVELYAQ